LQLIYGMIREAILERFGRKVAAIIVYGSITRPEDFAGNVSDIDVAVITNERIPVKERLDLFSDMRFQLDAVFLTKEQLFELASEGYPLIHYLKDGRLIYGDEKLLDSVNPTVTEKTLDILKRASIAAVGSAVESYLMGIYNDAVSHLYHALRYAVRWRIAEKKKHIPISNKDVYEALRELDDGGSVKTIFTKLIESRRGEVDSFKCRSLIEETVQGLANLHGFSRVTPWLEVERKLAQLKTYAALCEVKPIVNNDKLVWQLKLYDATNNKHMQLEV